MAEPNQSRVTDITYIRTHEGWLYLAVVVDLFTQQVVSWSMGSIRPIPAYDSHPMDRRALVLKRAEASTNAGYRAIKTKIGCAAREEDLSVLRLLKETVGPSVQILVDYNQGLTVPESVKRMIALEAEGLGWIEESTVQEKIRGCAEILAKVRVPVKMGENWRSVEARQRALDAGACDLAMPDVMKIGGVTG